MVIHREGKGSHAIGGEYFLARARGGSRAEEGLRRGGPQGGGARPSSGEVACERRKRGRKRRKARRAVREGLLHLREKGELSEDLEGRSQ